TLAAALTTGHLGVPLLLAIVFVLAVGWDIAWAVFMVAPPLVLAKRELFVAGGLGSILSVGTATGGYAGGAALLYLVGPAGGATAYAALLVAAAVAAVPLALRVDNPPGTGIVETFREGWRAFRGSAGRALRSVAALEIFLGGFTALPPLLITAIAYRNFADPAAVYGLFVTVYALGGSAAGVVTGHYNPRRSIGLLMALGALAAGLCVLGLLPTGSSELAVAALLGGAGAAVTVRFAARMAWTQGSFPPEILGRMVSNLYLFTGAASTAAVIVVGGFAAGISLTNLELVDGGGLLVGALLSWASPAVRSLAF
ncbi:MAG TPA: hypothetical protein VGU43_03900, partial [Thermoplasmata archaeon]|nr:hypothetical protein [Thermoplasmata archaeon]